MVETNILTENDIKALIYPLKVNGKYSSSFKKGKTYYNFETSNNVITETRIDANKNTDKIVILVKFGKTIFLNEKYAIFKNVIKEILPECFILLKR